MRVVLLSKNKVFSSDVWHFHCIWLGLFLFRLVNLSEGNCLMRCLFHIFDSGSELRVGPPFYTLSQLQGEAVWNVCRKNTFYINLRAPLVKTLAFMNHDRSLNGESGQNSYGWKMVSTSSGVGRLFSTAMQNAACSHRGGNCSLFWLFSVLLSVLQGQMPSVTHASNIEERSWWDIAQVNTRFIAAKKMEDKRLIFFFSSFLLLLLCFKAFL